MMEETSANGNGKALGTGLFYWAMARDQLSLPGIVLGADITAYGGLLWGGVGEGTTKPVHAQKWRLCLHVAV